ncbi:MAG TPA: outer membrane beta-barrel protein [Bryobacteraceae bacterium]|nr:outer membrane beta-barrel protein [Bryobacteraceae bacterium]
MSFRFLFPSMLVACGCFAQSWSVGGAAGYGFYNNATITNAGGSAEAGFAPRVAASAVLGQNVGNYFGGELRYTYRGDEAQLRSGGRQVNMDGQTHAIHYDFLVYATPRGTKIRPYAAAGAGIKRYMITDSEPLSQSLGNFAMLTHASQVEGLFSAGGGLKALISEHWLFRVDVRYYLTPFPEKLFAAASGARIHGWLHDFVPMAGIDWTFGK